FTAVLCVSSLITYAQSKEAKKEIRKYYTEKQIKYIEKELKSFFGDDGYTRDRVIYFWQNYEDYSYPKGEKQKKAYYNYFIYPYIGEFPNRLFYQVSLVEPKYID
ncbi:hypothetical protein ACTZMH_11410, partial [Ornithobacterium rhinotracheale]